MLVATVVAGHAQGLSGAARCSPASVVPGIALGDAGRDIERGSWRPGRGVGENRRTVEAVYGYYGRLFGEHPYLERAGLAGMIGPAFYAGFRDLGLLPDAARAAVIAVLGRASRATATAIDLTSAPTRESAGFAAGAGSGCG